MSVVSIQSSAESKAKELVERLRQEVILRVVSSRLNSAGESGDRSLSGRLLRAEIEWLVDRSLSSREFEGYLVDAWDDGVNRATRESRIATPSTVIRELSEFNSVMAKGYESLRSAMKDGIGRTISRATQGLLTKEEAIEKIGSSQNSGLFRDYQARAMGIADHEIQVVEGYAHGRRAREITERIIFEEKAGTRKKQIMQGKGGEELVSLGMITWHHSGGGNPPRANHVAMNMKAVPQDMEFMLIGRDGNEYWIKGPYDPKLPIGEIANCHCVASVQIIYVTRDRERQIREMAAATGGMRLSEVKKSARTAI